MSGMKQRERLAVQASQLDILLKPEISTDIVMLKARILMTVTYFICVALEKIMGVMAHSLLN
jgi:hypothetical protein